jgi:hypothetical protein
MQTPPEGETVQRQTASVYLKQLAEVGVLTELDAGKGEIVHPSQAHEASQPRRQ